MIEHIDLKVNFALHQWCRVKYSSYAFYKPINGCMYADEMQTRLYQKSYPLNACPITRGLLRMAYDGFETSTGSVNLTDFILVSHNALTPERIDFKRSLTRYMICLSDIDAEVAFDTDKYPTSFLRVFKIPPQTNILLREHNDMQNSGVYLIGVSNDFS